MRRTERQSVGHSLTTTRIAVSECLYILNNGYYLKQWSGSGVVNCEVKCDVCLVLLYFMNKEDFRSRVEADSNRGPHSRNHSWGKDVESQYVKHRHETRLTVRPIHWPCIKPEPHLIDIEGTIL